eukprot:107755-Rhodomonas_salina.1
MGCWGQVEELAQRLEAAALAQQQVSSSLSALLSSPLLLLPAGTSRVERGGGADAFCAAAGA